MGCYYLGCWNDAGHFLHAPGGSRAGAPRDLERYNHQRIHVDGSLAPRRMGRDWRLPPLRLPEGALCWIGQGETPDDWQAIRSRSGEYPQGQFLLHFLDTGYTAAQWWDRCQGDTRGGCNSTILLEGQHTADEVLAGLREHFPHVLANLERHGVQLVEVQRQVAPDGASRASR